MKIKRPKIVLVAKITAPNHEAREIQDWMRLHGYKLVAHSRGRPHTDMEFEVGGPCAGEHKDCLGHAPRNHYLCPYCQ